MSRHGRIAAYVIPSLVALCLAAAQAALASRVIDLAVSNGQLPQAQRLIAVTQGDEVMLRLTSDKPVEIHLHGYDIEASLSPGTTVSWRFVAGAAGRFPLELHGDRPGAERVIGYLEVRPR